MYYGLSISTDARDGMSQGRVMRVRRRRQTPDCLEGLGFAPSREHSEMELGGLGLPQPTVAQRGPAGD